MPPDIFADFLKIAALHFLAVASPGPDFAMVLKQSITRGRGPAIWTSIGIGAAILLHAAYSLMGIGLVIKSSIVAFNVLKIAAAAYLIWIGLRAIRAKPMATTRVAGASIPGAAARPGAWAAFVTGFMTNALNPKATIFLLSLFASFAHHATSVLIGYGLWMAFATAIWFTGVSLFFTVERVRAGFLRLGHWFERVMGGLLILLGARLAMETGK